MSDALWTSIISGAVGIAFVVVGRLVDRFLPDPEDKHPLPDPPAVKNDGG